MKEMEEKDSNKKYVERAADILANLVRQSRKNLPSVDEEAEKLKKDLAAIGKIDKVFSENSKKLIDLIRKRKEKK